MAEECEQRKKMGFLDHGFHVMQTGYPHSRAEIDFKELGARRFSPGAKIVKSSAGKAKQYVLSDPFRSPISSISALFTQKWSDLYNIAKLRLSSVLRASTEFSKEAMELRSLIQKIWILRTIH